MGSVDARDARARFKSEDVSAAERRTGSNPVTRTETNQLTNEGDDDVHERISPMTGPLSRIAGDAIAKLRAIEELYLRREVETDECRRFLVASTELELAIRKISADFYSMRGELEDTRIKMRRAITNLDEHAIVNVSLALVVATTIAWYRGTATEAELRVAVEALLEDPRQGEIAKRLSHEEPR